MAKTRKGGRRPGSGRKKGTPNKLTTAFKQAVQNVYGAIGGDGAFAKWARENPTEFYKIAARLIPHEVNANVTHEPIRQLLAAVDGKGRLRVKP